jgi:hypothetical protein
MKQLHEYAEFFPRLVGEDFKALCNDIKTNGLIQPIMLKDDKILDGVNRAKACEETGTRPKYEEFNGGNPLDYVISQNVLRRHLTPSQRAVLALELEKKFAAEPKAKGGRGQTGPDARPGFNTHHERKSAGRAARALHVGRASVESAKRLEKEAPHLIPAVRTGKITITEALIQHRNNRAEEWARKDSEKAKRKHLQENNRQVAELLEATKDFIVALKVAEVGAERFNAKETITFVTRRFDEIRRRMAQFEKDIKKGGR